MDRRRTLDSKKLKYFNPNYSKKTEVFPVSYGDEPGSRSDRALAEPRSTYIERVWQQHL
jgi:hypothetical protein